MRRINQFLPTELLSQAARFDAVTHALRGILPQSMAEHVWFAGTRGDSAVLITDSSSWVTPLRFEQNTILLHLERCCQISSQRIAIKVSPDGRPALK
ncbi:MAG: DciA family protein [Acidihalobacter sp.]|jgi:hypothetical protein|uniref:DciA family protein n=1 Tax=Acidihalobacter sp. TaxID=1872108 RepID=UPI00307EC140